VGAYTQTDGSTNLVGGDLGSTAPLIFTGGVLSGTGTVNGTVTGDAVTINAGSSPGTLNINGNLNLSPNSVVNVELGGTGAGQFDVINVTGTANLDGTLNILGYGGYDGVTGDSYTVTTWAAYTGGFATINQAQNFTASETYNNTDFALDVGGLYNYWVGGSGDWSNPANWSRNAVPTAGEAVVLDVPGTATITISGGTNNISNLTSSEDVVLSGGVLDIATLMTVNGSFTQTGGTVDGLGALDVNGLLLWSGGDQTGGGTTFANGGISFTGAGARTLNNRILDITGPVSLGSGETLTVANGSTINGAGTFVNQGVLNLVDSTLGMALNNAGTVNADGANAIAGGALTNTGAVNVYSGNTALASGQVHLNQGIIDIAAGSTLDVGAGSSLVNDTIGIIRGRGSLDASGIGASLINNGSINPGTSPGILTVLGNFPGTGILNIELGGTTPGSGYDQLNISGQGSLTGTLNVSFWNGYTPNVGDSFQILNYGTAGTLTPTINGPAGYTFTVTDGGTYALLTVTGAPAAPPAATPPAAPPPANTTPPDTGFVPAEPVYTLPGNDYAPYEDALVFFANDVINIVVSLDEQWWSASAGDLVYGGAQGYYSSAIVVSDTRGGEVTAAKEDLACR
jgi:hypothetical protein